MSGPLPAHDIPSKTVRHARGRKGVARGEETSTRRAAPARALVHLDAQAKAELLTLRREIRTLRDHIAEDDLAVETLRCALADFVRRYEAAVAQETAQLARVQMLHVHLLRWLKLLTQPTQHGHRLGGSQAGRLRRARERELRAYRQRYAAAASGQGRAHAEPLATPAQRTRTEAGTEADATATGEKTDGMGPSWHARRQQQAHRLKQAFRTLARRFHPDMVQDAGERAKRSRYMVHINGLYAAGEVAHLEQLVLHQQDPPDHAETDDAARAGPSLAEQVAQAQDQLRWLQTVQASLRDEYQTLQRSPTHGLWQALEGGERAHAPNAQLLAQLRRDILAEAEARTQELPAALKTLEDAVDEYNLDRQQAACRPRGRAVAKPAQARRLTLWPAFDAHVGQDLMRLGLQDIAGRRASPRIRAWGERLQARAQNEPAFVQLMLLTYVLQLSPGAMPGLENFAQLERRFAASLRPFRCRVSLAEALLAADGLVEYAPTARPAGPVTCGLVFRDRALAEVVPQALRSFAVRRLFASLLGHLGEEGPCPTPRCGRSTFAVPLFLLRGLGDVRANVCPRCAAVVRSYVLAKGHDVQSALNATFLDFELVCEWTLTFAQATLGLQLLPWQEHSLRVRDLLYRVREHLFARHDLTLPARALALWQDGRRLPDLTALADLPHRRATLVLTEPSMSEAEALTTLRYRIKTRFARP